MARVITAHGFKFAVDLTSGGDRVWLPGAAEVLQRKLRRLSAEEVAKLHTGCQQQLDGTVDLEQFARVAELADEAWAEVSGEMESGSPLYIIPEVDKPSGH